MEFQLAHDYARLSVADFSARAQSSDQEESSSDSSSARLECAQMVLRSNVNSK